MWQEARKQEKKLRGIMIDFKKRAERRQAYYAKMKTDPHQLMRVYGQKCKLHILTDSSRVIDTDGQLVAWQGDPDIMIDRFDVRSHLDYIPEVIPKPPDKTEDEEKEERKCNYESYRTLVQIDATGATEEQYLNQLVMEESYGKKMAAINEEKARSKAKAKIHYEYKDSTKHHDESDDDGMSDSNDDESDGELSDIDINVNVMELNEEQKNHLDALSTQYGIGYGQYCRQLLLEKKEFEYVKRLEEEEEERSKMPGRKGKAARRNLRMKQKSLRGSPLSFALETNQDGDGESSDESSGSDHGSRSRTPDDGKIEFITSFGGEDEESKPKKPSITKSEKSLSKSSESRRKIKDNEGSKSHKTSSSSRRSPSRSRDRYCSSRRRSRDERHRSRSRSRDGRHRSRSRSRGRRSRSRDGRHKSRSRSRDRRHKSRSRSRDVRRKSRSQSREKVSHRSRSDSRDDKSGQTKRKSNSKSPERHKSSRGRDERGSSSSSSSSRSRSRSRDRSYHKKSRSRSPPSKSVAKALGASKSSAATPVDKSKLTAREKMKLRMQKLLNKQIKQDKKQEEKKQIAKELEAEERDVQIYEMSKIMKSRERDRKRRSPSPKGRLDSYDASKFQYRPRSRSPV